MLLNSVDLWHFEGGGVESERNRGCASAKSSDLGKKLDLCLHPKGSFAAQYRSSRCLCLDPFFESNKKLNCIGAKASGPGGARAADSDEVVASASVLPALQLGVHGPHRPAVHLRHRLWHPRLHRTIHLLWSVHAAAELVGALLHDHRHPIARHAVTGTAAIVRPPCPALSLSIPLACPFPFPSL